MTLPTTDPPQTRTGTLRVDDLRVHYLTRDGIVRAVDGVSFSLNRGERLGLVGESGSGKSTIALALLRLIRPPGYIASGQIWLGPREIAGLDENEMRQVRLAEIAFIPQGAMNSLNPVTRIKRQFSDIYRAHDINLGKRELGQRVAELLTWVGLQPEVADRFPHELSGGMKQRVCIAMAVALRPSVIIADEPTSALDVVVQRQIMQTLARVQERLAAAVLLIGHDMGLMAQFVDRVGVMYGGNLMETGPTRPLFKEALHPYTKALIASLPTFDHAPELAASSGLSPSSIDRPAGCIFHPRCPYVMDRCRTEIPPWYQIDADRGAACFLLNGGGRDEHLP